MCLGAGSSAPRGSNRGLTAAWVPTEGEFLPNFKKFLCELWPFMLRIHITIQEGCVLTIDAITSNYYRH